MLLKVRPIYHWRERRVRAHLFVCLLAYYLEWHLRRRLAPLLFAEEGEPEAAASPVAAAQRSPAAKRNNRTRETLAGDLPLQSLPDLLASLSTLTAVELVYESGARLRGSDAERDDGSAAGGPSSCWACSRTRPCPWRARRQPVRRQQRPLHSHTRSVANREDSTESQPNRYAWLCDKPLQTRSL